jgi:hypothetical protein
MKLVEEATGQVTFLKADPRAGRPRVIAAPSTEVLYTWPCLRCQAGRTMRPGIAEAIDNRR